MDSARSQRATSAPPSLPTSTFSIRPKVSAGAGFQSIHEQEEESDNEIEIVRIVRLRKDSPVTNEEPGSTVDIVKSVEGSTRENSATTEHTGDVPSDKRRSNNDDGLSEFSDDTDYDYKNEALMTVEVKELFENCLRKFNDKQNGFYEYEDCHAVYDQQENVQNANNKSVWKATTTDQLRAIAKMIYQPNEEHIACNDRWASMGQVGSTFFDESTGEPIFKISIGHYVDNNRHRSHSPEAENDTPGLLKLHEDAKIIRDAAASQRRNPEHYTSISVEDWHHVERLATSFAQYNLHELGGFSVPLQTLLSACARTVESNDLVAFRDSLRAIAQNLAQHFFMSGTTILPQGFRGEELLSHGAIQLPHENQYIITNAWPSLANPIHEFFREDNFHGLTTPMYQTMKPSLRLASMFLTYRPLMLYWHMLVFGKRELCTDTSQKRDETAYRIREIPPVTPETELQLTDFLRTLANHVSFSFTYVQQGLFGLNTPLRQSIFDCCEPGPKTTAGRSSIVLHPDFYLIITRHTYTQNPDPATILRFNMLLANLLVHEVAHSVEREFHGIGDQPRQFGVPTTYGEAYLGDLTWNEAGHAWSRFALGGTVEPIGFSIDVCHGLMVYPRDFDEDPVSCTREELPFKSVPMVHVWALQQQAFWDAGPTVEDIKINTSESARASIGLVEDILMWVDEAEQRDEDEMMDCKDDCDDDGEPPTPPTPAMETIGMLNMSANPRRS